MTQFTTTNASAIISNGIIFSKKNPNNRVWYIMSLINSHSPIPPNPPYPPYPPFRWMSYTDSNLVFSSSKQDHLIDSSTNTKALFSDRESAAHQPFNKDNPSRIEVSLRAGPILQIALHWSDTSHENHNFDVVGAGNIIVGVSQQSPSLAVTLSIYSYTT